MSVKDLMIGDYIYDSSFVERRICKVVGIHVYPGYDMGNVEVEPLCSPGNSTKLTDVEIEPIPLTKEMLLANGWRDDLTLMYEKKNYYYNGLKLYPYGNLWLATYSGNNQCLFGNVHELQRLMRGLRVYDGETFKLE